MYQVLNEPPRRATVLNPRLPLALDAVLERALAKQPSERFQDAGAFIAVLDSLQLVERETATDGSTATGVAPVQAPPPLATNAPPGGGDPTLLVQAERFLIETLGPVARVLVRKAALQAGSPVELIEQLMTVLPGEPERLRFQRRMRAIVGGTLTGLGTAASASMMGSQMSGALGSFDQTLLETARRVLVVQSGPIAKVLVKQTVAPRLGPSRSCISGWPSTFPPWLTGLPFSNVRHGRTAWAIPRNQHSQCVLASLALSKRRFVAHNERYSRPSGQHPLRWFHSMNLHRFSPGILLPVCRAGVSLCVSFRPANPAITCPVIIVAALGPPGLYYEQFNI